VRWGNEHPRTEEDCLLFSPSGRVRAAATRETDEFDFLVFPAVVHKDARWVEKGRVVSKDFATKNINARARKRGRALS
jgi:hypothetical protein